MNQRSALASRVETGFVKEGEDVVYFNLDRSVSKGVMSDAHREMNGEDQMRATQNRPFYDVDEVRKDELSQEYVEKDGAVFSAVPDDDLKNDEQRFIQ